MPPGSPRECYRLLDRQPGSPDKVGRMIWVFISKGQSEEEPHVVRYVQFPLHNGRIVAQRTLRTRSQAVSGQCQHQRLSKHADIGGFPYATPVRSEEHTSELQSLMRISYAVFCLKKKHNANQPIQHSNIN